ncbi:hypothetical protein LEP1GSC041_2899 [Leptospira noguchii str. 2006001870]|nr:hypothetical protein LEP1GSC041_2899 [Leptospira noguchii str. 2006001870]
MYKRFQSTSFSKKGRNVYGIQIVYRHKCFNPLPFQKKEETPVF